ncbi:MAG: hypothetical protein IPN53_23185 [Comamonadaceae bacterium]|nr:hypothetical protein [Comamonadaceae bacterium]
MVAVEDVGLAIVAQRRLCSVPNPATYCEDRIADEYPKGIPKTSNAGTIGTKKLSDLFGTDE